LAAAGTIQALWSIGQFVTQTTFANKWLGVAIHPVSQGGTSVVLTQAGIWLRAYAGQVHPNVLGGLLVVSCLATVYLIIKNYKFKIISFYWLLVLYVVQLTGLFFSFSRGAWLALAASLCLWWWHSRPNRRELWPAFGWAAVVFVVLTVILWQPTAGRFFGHSRLEQQSVEERVGSVGESRSLLSGSWWHGVGYGNYTVALERLQPGLRSWRYQPVHNIFLLALTELGVIGLGLFLWLLWIILSPLTTRSSPLVPVAGGYWLMAIIFTALFDHYWWTAPSMVLLFWLVIVSASAGEQPPGQGS